MWEQKVNGVMEIAGKRRVNGKVASERTQTLTKEVVYAAIRRLHELGYKIQDPKNLGERHIEALVKDWWYCKHKKIKTIQNELSRLRVFCGMLGKPGMVGAVQKYLPDVSPELLIVRTAARETKAWAGHGIDMVRKFREVDERDSRLGLMLRLELAFGLRREEVLKCNPHTQDFGHYLQVFPGMGKGGRWRNVPVTSAAQRALLNYVKTRSDKKKPLGWEYSESGKAVSLEQNVRRYENLMASLGLTKADCGVTGHGLRAQFAENHTLLHGLVPPTLGGGSAELDRGDLSVVKVKVAQALGHNRESIMNAYIGAFEQRPRAGKAGPIPEVVRKAIRVLDAIGWPPVAAERERDCCVIRDAMAELDMHITTEQAHGLWAKHARRHGVDWMKPEHEIAIAMSVTASNLVKDFFNVVKGE